MKNPIISAIKKTLRVKNDKRAMRDYGISMIPMKIYEIVDLVMQDKVWSDLENESNEDLYQRMPVPFHTFMYDAMIMRFGL